jgi:hypothetical protein
MDPFKGKMQRLIVGKTPAFEVDKFMTDVDQYAFSLEGEGDQGYGYLLFRPDGQKEYEKRTGDAKMPQELEKPELPDSSKSSDIQIFKIKEKRFEAQEAAKRAIKKAMLGPLDADSIQMLKIDGDLREPMNFKVNELRDRMGVVFGRQKQSETAALQASMSEPVDEDLPMEVACAQFKEKQSYLEKIGQTVASAQAIMMLTTHVGGAGGKYEQAIRDFSKTPEADRTIGELMRVLIQESQRLISNTAAAQGFAATAQGRGGRGSGGGRGAGGKAGGRGGGRIQHNPKSPIFLCWSCGPQLDHDGNGCPSPEQGHDSTATFLCPNNARIRFCAVKDRAKYPHP